MSLQRLKTPVLYCVHAAIDFSSTDYLLLLQVIEATAEQLDIAHRAGRLSASQGSQDDRPPGHARSWRARGEHPSGKKLG